MSGSREGAKRAVVTKRKRYGKEIFRENGKLGGQARNASEKKFSPFSESAEYASAQGKIGAAKRWAKSKEAP